MPQHRQQKANPWKDAHAALAAAVLAAYGVPKNYPDAKKLVTEDCIRPYCAEVAQ